MKNQYIRMRQDHGSYHGTDWVIEMNDSLGLLLTAEQRNMFLSLCYWRDIVARVYEIFCSAER